MRKIIEGGWPGLVQGADVSTLRWSGAQAEAGLSERKRRSRGDSLCHAQDEQGQKTPQVLTANCPNAQLGSMSRYLADLPDLAWRAALHTMQPDQWSGCIVCTHGTTLYENVYWRYFPAYLPNINLNECKG